MRRARCQIPPMQLFVIRHAVAEDVGPTVDDPARELTDAGRTKLRRVVRGLRALDIRFERILCSPWKRAELLALIAERSETTAVVGHEPWLGELVAWLAFGDTRHGDAVIIKKCGVV